MIDIADLTKTFLKDKPDNTDSGKYREFLCDFLDMGIKGIYELSKGKETFQVHDLCDSKYQGCYAIHEGNHRAIMLHILGEKCLRAQVIQYCGRAEQKFKPQT